MTTRSYSGGWIQCCVCLVVCILTAEYGRAEKPSALAARLHAAAVNSSIDMPGLVPWHLKLDVQLFDAKGKPAQQGTIEEWWVSPDETRIGFTMPSYTVTLLHNKEGDFRTKGQTYPPALLTDVLDQIVSPMPHESEIDSSKPDLRKQSFGKVPLDCIMLDQPLTNVAFPPLGLFPTFCLDPGKDSLRITTELGSLMFVRNTVGTFQKRSVATQVTGSSVDGLVVVTGHVTLLSTMQMNDADFSPGKEMESITERATGVSADIMAGNVLTRVNPTYPETAKQKRITGTVVMGTTIGADGRVEKLRLISTPDADLAMSAIAAVRKWVYKPFTLNGVPVEVETTIKVSFAMGR